MLMFTYQVDGVAQVCKASEHRHRLLKACRLQHCRAGLHYILSSLPFLLINIQMQTSTLSSRFQQLTLFAFWISICQHTNTKNIAGQSASFISSILASYHRFSQRKLLKEVPSRRRLHSMSDFHDRSCQSIVC